ncbi:MAG: hypothetical protein SFT92_02140 [Rickettsiales bacterium]|nr:hypothetical protein [Rickettsiales bacterium]
MRSGSATFWADIEDTFQDMQKEFKQLENFLGPEHFNLPEHLAIVKSLVDQYKIVIEKAHAETLTEDDIKALMPTDQYTRFVGTVIADTYIAAGAGVENSTLCGYSSFDELNDKKHDVFNKLAIIQVDHDYMMQRLSSLQNHHAHDVSPDPANRQWAR